MIRNDIDNEGVTHIAICACSRRAKTEAFNFTTVAMSRGNLREGVIWIRPDTDAVRETTQEMAEDYVRMACAEVKAMRGSGRQPEHRQQQDPAGGRWRHVRHDCSTGSLQDRLQGGVA